MSGPHISPGSAEVTNFIICPRAQEVASFVMDVFDARSVRPPLYHSDGKLWNYELRIGSGAVMIAEAAKGMTRPGFTYVYVPDAAATIAKALAHGATEVMPPEEQFYGNFDGGVEDMGGNWWWIGTHSRDLSPEEIEAGARAEEARREKMA